MTLQVTFFCDNGKYKPVSAIVEVPNSYAFIKHKNYWIDRAKKIIKSKRYWTNEDMENFGYTIHKERFLPPKENK